MASLLHVDRNPLRLIANIVSYHLFGDWKNLSLYFELATAREIQFLLLLDMRIHCPATMSRIRLIDILNSFGFMSIPKIF